MSRDDDAEPFLARWSRLKRERKSTVEPGNGTPTPPTDSPATSARAAGPEAADAAPDATAADAPLEPADLPRLEDLTADSDLSRFLDPRVPSGLRNAAIKRMWSLDPTIRDFIEVAEWQWDWNTPGGMPGYGPLEPGTDVASLVAQATGALNNLAKVPDADDAHDNVTAQPLDDAADPVTAPSLCAVPQHGDVAAAGAADLAASPEPMPAASMKATAPTVSDPQVAHPAAQHHASAAASEARPGRRRHGTALPV